MFHEPQKINRKKIDLTPTGLLMEGHYTLCAAKCHFERNGDLSTVQLLPGR